MYHQGNKDEKYMIITCHIGTLFYSAADQVANKMYPKKQKQHY